MYCPSVVISFLMSPGSACKKRGQAVCRLASSERLRWGRPYCWSSRLDLYTSCTVAGGITSRPPWVPRPTPVLGVSLEGGWPPSWCARTDALPGCQYLLGIPSRVPLRGGYRRGGASPWHRLTLSLIKVDQVTDIGSIHRSAWNRSSRNFALTAFWEVRRDDPRDTSFGGCATLALGASCLW